MRILSPQEFLKTPAGADAQRQLRRLVSSSSYDTNGSYDPGAGRGLTFVERHLDYLMKHPHVSPTAYLSNLRIMTKTGR